MTESDLILILQERAADASRGSKEDGELQKLGIGLTEMRKLAKEIGRDHDLAMQLWGSDIFEARVMSLLIDDPRHMTEAQAETQVENLREGALAHVFSSCDASLAKTPFVVDLSVKWVKSQDPIRRQCGYGLLYEISKSKKKTAPDDDFFEHWIEHIRHSFPSEVISVNHAMGVALMGMGSRNVHLYHLARDVAEEMGPLQIDQSGNTPKFFDVREKLSHKVVLQRLGITSS